MNRAPSEVGRQGFLNRCSSELEGRRDGGVSFAWAPCALHLCFNMAAWAQGDLMTHSLSDVGVDLYPVLVESYTVNERMNQIVLEYLDPAAWRLKLPGSKGRTIAAIVAHVHNMRRKWLRLSAPHLKLPAPLDRAKCTQKEAQRALAESGVRCSEMLVDALSRPQSRIKTFHRDGWARPWPAGAAMVAYMISHDAHHRGQVCMLAHQLGFPLPTKGASGIWAWEKLWKECGFTQPR
jgi:uncharacterized damage-inducible protein DinB